MDININTNNINPEDRMQLNSFINLTISKLTSYFKASKGTALEPQTLK
jgi:spore germination protein YaaH